MIARVRLLLPFKLWTIPGTALPPIEKRLGDRLVRVYPPVRGSVEYQSGNTPAMWNRAIKSVRPSQDQAPVQGLSHGGAQVVDADLLGVEVEGPDFDRRIFKERGLPVDPDPVHFFSVANDFLSAARTFTRAASVDLLDSERTPWHLEYLADDGSALPEQDGWARGYCWSGFPVEGGVLTPQRWAAIGRVMFTGEPVHWEVLLIRARWYLPDLGPAVVAALGGLEAFISHALGVLRKSGGSARTSGKRGRNRSCAGEPSLADRFDVNLRAATGSSLKSKPELWKGFMKLKKIRNDIAHGGHPSLDEKPVTAEDVGQLIANAQEIAKWVETLLPETERRFSLVSPSEIGFRIDCLEPIR